MNDYCFISKPTEEDLSNIKSWSELYNFKCAIAGYKRNQLFCIRLQDCCIAFMSYYRAKFISTIELSEVQPDMRNMGIGGSLLENALFYFRKTRIKGVELFYTSEGARRHAQKYGFEKQIKENEDENDSLPWMFRVLIPTRSQKQVSGRMFVIWKNDRNDSSKSPDMFWPIDEDTNFPILTYCFKDWTVGLMESGKVISTNKAKRFFGNNPVEFNGEYLFINHSFDRWFQMPNS